MTDIDVGMLGKWLATNTTAATKFPNTAGMYAISNVPNILYVADNRTYTNRPAYGHPAQEWHDDSHQHGQYRRHQPAQRVHRGDAQSALCLGQLQLSELPIT